MGSNRVYPLFLLALSVLVSCVLIGCGYSVHRQTSLPFPEIGIGLIENRTLEPKLQDKLHRALVEEFLRQGMRVSPGARHTLACVINSFDMVSLSEKNDITAEYRVIISADFTLTDNEGGKREIKNVSTPFIVSFSGAEDMGRLIAGREVAEEKALRDIATEIAGMLIYR